MDHTEYETLVADIRRVLDVELGLARALNFSADGYSDAAAQAWDDFADQFAQLAQTARRIAEGMR
jgi:hypothetical protein